MRTVGALHVVTGSASAFRAVVAPVGGDRVRPLRASDALTMSTRAVVNGPMFSKCVPGDSYDAQQCERIAYVLRIDGTRFPGRHPGDGCTLSIVGGVASFDEPAPVDASIVVQLAPCLVRRGRAIAQASTPSNLSTTWRAGVALLPSGELAFAVSYSPLQQFADALERDLDASAAGYTDGGGSARLAEHGAAIGSRENRPVASWLAFVDEGSVAVVSRARENSSAAGTVLLVAGGVGAGILAWNAYRRRRRR